MSVLSCLVATDLCILSFLRSQKKSLCPNTGGPWWTPLTMEAGELEESNGWR